MRSSMCASMDLCHVKEDLSIANRRAFSFCKFTSGYKTKVLLRKDIHIGKEEDKLSLFADDIKFIVNPKDSTKKLLE